MENECEALPGVAYPGVRDNRSTLNTKTGYDDDSRLLYLIICLYEEVKLYCQTFISSWSTPFDFLRSFNRFVIVSSTWACL